MPGSAGSEGSDGTGATCAVLDVTTLAGRTPLDVLVVGHRRLLAEALCEVLAREGYRAGVSAAGPIASELATEIETLRPTVVVIEVPDVRTSRELADLVPRLRQSGTPVLMLLPERLREAGARAQRPVAGNAKHPGAPLRTPLDEFLASVARAVGSPRAVPPPAPDRGGPHERPAGPSGRSPDAPADSPAALAGRTPSSFDPSTSRAFDPSASRPPPGLGGLEPRILAPDDPRARSRREGRTAEKSPLAELTAKEEEVLRALMTGTPAPEVAKKLNVSVSTVRNHIRAIFGKLGVRSQLAAVAAAYRAGWSREGRGVT